MDLADIEEIINVQSGIRLAARQLDWATYILKDAVNRLSAVNYRIADAMRIPKTMMNGPKKKGCKR